MGWDQVPGTQEYQAVGGGMHLVLSHLSVHTAFPENYFISSGS